MHSLLHVAQGGDQAARKVNLTSPLYPAAQRALDILSKYFENVILAEDKQVEDFSIKNLLPSPESLEFWKPQRSYACSRSRWSDCFKSAGFLLVFASAPHLWKETWDNAALTSTERWNLLCSALRDGSARVAIHSHDVLLIPVASRSVISESRACTPIFISSTRYQCI